MAHRAGSAWGVFLFLFIGCNSDKTEMLSAGMETGPRAGISLPVEGGSAVHGGVGHSSQPIGGRRPADTGGQIGSGPTAVVDNPLAGQPSAGRAMPPSGGQFGGTVGPSGGQISGGQPQQGGQAQGGQVIEPVGGTIPGGQPTA